MANSTDDRFSHTLPPFKAPNSLLAPLPKKPNEPSLSLEEQKQAKKVSQLLADAKAISDKVLQERVSVVAIKAKPIKPRYCAAHVMNDSQFIRTTISMCIHDKGAMQLLLANGGGALLDNGMLPGQAWDLLRAQKKNALRSTMGKAPGKDSDRRRSAPEGKSFTAGIPTWRERAARIGMHLVKSEEE